MDSKFNSLILSAIASLAALSATGTALARDSQKMQHFIVQADSAGVASDAVRRTGGHVLRALPIIDSVAAEMTANEQAALQRRSGIHVYEDRAVAVSANATPATNSPPSLYTPLVNGAASPP